MCPTCEAHHAKFRLLKDHRTKLLGGKPIGSAWSNYVNIDVAGKDWRQVGNAKYGGEPDSRENTLQDNDLLIVGSEEADDDYLNDKIVAEMKQKKNDNKKTVSNQEFQSHKDSCLGDLDCSSFDVNVAFTDLAPSIGLNERPYTMVISPNGIHLKQGTITAMEARFNVIRKFGTKTRTKEFIIEFGRGFQYGEGRLYFRAQNADSIVSCLSRNSSRR